MRFFLLFLIMFQVLFAKNSTLLPEHLQDFLHTHQSITLGSCDEWIPYVIKNKDGSISGYDVDILNLINHYTGAHFVLKAGNWKNIIQLSKEGYLDGLSTLIETPKRKEWLLFSKPYISIVKVILTRKDYPFNHLSKKQLEGKTIALNEGNVLDQRLAKELGLNIYYFKTIKEAYKAVFQGKVDFVLGNTSTEYELERLGFGKLKTVYILEQKNQLRFAIRKDLPEAMQILSIGLQRIPKSKFQKIEKKWFLQNYTYTKLILSQQEKDFLKSKKKIFVCTPKNNYYPFYSQDNKQEIYGITIDILHYLGNILNTPFQFTSSQKCNLSLEKINQFTLPSKPYFFQSLVLVTNTDKPYIEKINTITKPIAILKSQYIQILKKLYPNIRFIKYTNIQKALYAVRNEKVFGYIDLLSVATSNIERYGMKNLKISAQLTQKGTLTLWSNSKIFSSILSKAITQMDNARKQYIYNRWVNIKIEEVNSFKHLKEFIIFFLTIIIISAFWIQKLIKVNKQIELLNHDLQHRIDQKIKEEKEKDVILYQQSKLAQLGEIVGMIAHQWRQPLNNISLVASSIKIKAKRNKLDTNQIIQYTQKIIEHTQHLSQTIDDFRNFFKQTKESEIFFIDSMIKEVYNIVILSLKSTKIHLELDLNTTTPIQTYKNELMQVLLNIIRNAQDIILENKIKNGSILISSFEKENEFIIKIKDNGGGIDDQYIDKIFDLYFSTKSKNGTGLGLYMSKIIIEKHCKGKLEVKNEDSGAVFEIRLKNQ